MSNNLLWGISSIKNVSFQTCAYSCSIKGITISDTFEYVTTKDACVKVQLHLILFEKRPIQNSSLGFYWTNYQGTVLHICTYIEDP